MKKGKNVLMKGLQLYHQLLITYPDLHLFRHPKRKKYVEHQQEKRPPGKLILRKEKQCENKERPGSPSKLIPKKSIFREMMKTLMQEQDHTEIRPKRQKQSSQVCAGCSVQLNTPRDKEILKDDKHDWIACNFEDCNYWGHALCLGIVLGKKDPQEIDLLCPIHKKSYA